MSNQLPSYLQHAIDRLLETTVMSDRGGGAIARKRARAQLEDAIRAYGEDQRNGALVGVRQTCQQMSRENADQFLRDLVR